MKTLFYGFRSFTLAAVIAAAGVLGLPALPVMAEDGPECWAVIVGISEYEDGDDLLYCDDGAQSLYDMLAPAWGEDHLKLLLNEEAAKLEILFALDWLADVAAPEDTVLFYFAGHGSDNGYIAPHDARFVHTWISRNELRTRLDSVPSEHRAVIIDSCHAGQFETGLSVDGSVSLFSSRADEYSWEYGLLQNLVFTNYVLDALASFDDADANHDYELTAEEVFDYAEENTIATTELHEVQHPVLADVYEGELALLESLEINLNPRLSSSSEILVLDGTSYTSIPSSFVFKPGSSHEVKVTTNVQKGVGTRYIFSSWSDGEYSASRVVASGAYTAKYATEYLLKVISTYGAPDAGGWKRSGTPVEISVPGVVEEPGIRHIFDGWIGDFKGDTAISTVVMNKAINTTAVWRDEFLLTLESEYGTPEGAGWYPDGETVEVAIEGLVEEPGTRHYFTGWRGGIIDEDTDSSVTMDAPVEATAGWRHEHLVTLESEYGTVSGEGWYREGETATVSSTTVEGFLVRHIFDGWSGDSGSGNAVSDLTVDGPKTVTATWRTDFIQLYFLLGGVMLIAVITVLAVRLRRKAV